MILRNWRVCIADTTNRLYILNQGKRVNMMKLKKTVTTICISSAMVYGALTPLQEAIAQEVKKPNFVTIILDDLGYSDIGVFGGEASTPHLDELANKGVILNNFYAGATSSPSRSMLYTGKDHHTVGMGVMRENIANKESALYDDVENNPNYKGMISLDVPLFPQVLQDNNYHTMMVGKWHMGGDHEGDDVSYYPSKRGFTETRALLLSGGDMNYMTDEKGEVIATANLYVENEKKADLSKLGPSALTVTYYTNEAIKMLDEWSKKSSDKPFYLNMAYLSPHEPWQAPKALVDKYAPVYAVGWEELRKQRFEKVKKLGYVKPNVELPPMPKGIKSWNSLSDREKQLEARRMAVYTAMVDALDNEVGRLIQHLKDIGAYENTVFFIYSDNGAAAVGFTKKGEGYTKIGELLKITSDTEFKAKLEEVGSPRSIVDPSPAWGAASNIPRSGYKGSSMEGSIHTAAFIHYPKAKVSGINYGCLHSVLDIAPTILDMAGITYPTTYQNKPNPPLQGVSMANIFDGQLFCNLDRWLGFELVGLKGVRQGNWKLAQRMGGAYMGLFNVWDDPFEQYDLTGKEPVKFKEMMDIYQQYATENKLLDLSPYILPNLLPNVADKNAARIRVGTAIVNPMGIPFGFKKDIQVNTTVVVNITGEIRPAKKHIGKPAKVYAYAEYTPSGASKPAYFWITETGLIYQEGKPVRMPFKQFQNLPEMIFIPIFEGTLPQEANIKVKLSYYLPDSNTWVDNESNPASVSVTMKK